MGGRQWRVDTGQRFINDATQLNAAQCDLAAFLLDVVEFFTEEAKVAVLFAKRDDGVVEQVFDRLGHSVRLRGPGDAGVHQTGDVLAGDGQVAQNLQNGDGLGDVLMQLGMREADLGGFLHRCVQRGEGALDVFIQRIKQRDRGRQPANSLLCHGGLAFRAFNQNVLHHLDRRAQADAAGGLGQRAEQVQQDVEVSRQERIQIDKGLAIEIDAIDARIDQLGVLAQLLAILIKQPAQLAFRC